MCHNAPINDKWNSLLECYIKCMTSNNFKSHTQSELNRKLSKNSNSDSECHMTTVCDYLCRLFSRMASANLVKFGEFGEFIETRRTRYAYLPMFGVGVLHPELSHLCQFGKYCSFFLFCGHVPFGVLSVLCATLSKLDLSLIHI